MPGEQINLLELGLISPRSFWSALIEFSLMGEEATFQELFYNREVANSLVALSESQVNNDSARITEPVSHKGMAIPKRLSLGTRKVVISEQSKPGRLYLLSQDATKKALPAWGQPDCPDIKTLHQSLLLFPYNQVQYQLPTEKKKLPINSAGWAVPHSYTLDIDNQTTANWVIEFRMKPAQHQVRFVYQITQKQDSSRPWKSYHFNQSTHAETIETIVIRPGRSEINVSAILAGPSYGRVTNELVFNKEERK